MGVNNEIVFVEHCPPIFCRKIWYWQRPIFRRRANLPLPDIEPIEIRLPPAPLPLEKEDPVTETNKFPRAITPEDVPKLGKLKLTGYAADFSSVQLPKGEKLTGDDLQRTFESFISAVEA